MKHNGGSKLKAERRLDKNERIRYPGNASPPG